jgi:putative membrane protein
MTGPGVPLLPWTRWQLPLEVAVGLGVLLLIYVALIGPFRPASSGRVEGQRVAAFVSGILTLFLALTGPLGDLAGTFLFSAHMVQHLMLTVIAPPLLLFGTPGWLIRPLVLSPPLAPLARVVTRPAIAFAVFSVILTAWHLPVLYNLSLADRGVHITMHLMFIASAVVGWWPLMSPLPELPRLSLPMQMLYVSLLGVPMVVVAALVTLADGILYPHYAAAPRLWGISALQDQKIGGVIMWVPGHMVFLVALSIVFFRWANDTSGEAEGRADRRREATRDA